MNASAWRCVFLVCTPILGGHPVLCRVEGGARCTACLQRAMDRLNNVVQEGLTAIRAVKAFVRGEYEQEKFETGEPGSHGHQPENVPLCRAEPARFPAGHVHCHRAA